MEKNTLPYLLLQQLRRTRRFRWKKKTNSFALMYLKILADFDERYRPRSRLCIILVFSGIGTATRCVRRTSKRVDV